MQTFGQRNNFHLYFWQTLIIDDEKIEDSYGIKP